jgi:type VI protein secretion system component Hcp
MTAPPMTLTRATDSASGALAVALATATVIAPEVFVELIDKTTGTTVFSYSLLDAKVVEYKTTGLVGSGERATERVVISYSRLELAGPAATKTVIVAG